MPISLLFSVDSCLHTLFAHCSTISTRIIRGHYVDYPRPLRGFSAVDTRIIWVGPRSYLGLSARNNHGILRKKFVVSHTVCMNWKQLNNEVQSILLKSHWGSQQPFGGRSSKLTKPMWSLSFNAQPACLILLSHGLYEIRFNPSQAFLFHMAITVA